jgi:hypothetical protein
MNLWCNLIQTLFVISSQNNNFRAPNIMPKKGGRSNHTCRVYNNERKIINCQLSNMLYYTILTNNAWKTLKQVEMYLRRIMNISNKKSATATSSIMPSPLSIKDMGIKIESLLFMFLKNIA